MASLLIIDDDVTLLARLSAQLEAAGFQVARSSDVLHGEQLFAEQRPDLVILEVRTGDGRGWDLLEHLASERPVIVLSGAALEEDVVRAFEAGAADFIAKPYRSAELLARIRARLSEPTAAALASTPVASAVGATPPAARSLPVSAPAPGPVAAPEGGSPLPAPSARPVAVPQPRSNSKRRHARDDHDETAFMSEAEEMALLRAPFPARGQPPASAILTEEEAGRFGPGLRAERMRRHLTLVQLENELHIRMSYLQAIEDEKFTLLPRGPAALDMIRRYARHLGIDPAPVIDALGSKFALEVIEPLPSLGGAPAPRSLLRWIIALIAVLLALAVGVGAIVVFDPEFFSRALTFFQELWRYLLRLTGMALP
ncbi:MAG: response regulator [Chloroflexaceae bacterium]